jgi:hypothetical protein
LANIFNINNQTIKTTASITITDQTDVANLVGGLTIVKGGKNQVYLVGSSTPFSPDWKRNNLIIRPYLYASTIVKNAGLANEYSPDLFDSTEYPSLEDVSADGVYTPYINTSNLNWFIRDINGVESLIDPDIDSRFSYKHDTEDKRYLVIKDNIINKDSSATIICRFNYFDPFAKQNVKQVYELDLTCLSTGQGSNEVIINSINGTTIRNGVPGYVDLYTSFFKDGVEVDMQGEIENSATSSRLRWYLRGADGASWILLDNTIQNEASYAYMDMFEIRRYVSKDTATGAFTTEETMNARGGFYLRLYPALISGSSIVKAVFKDSTTNREYSAVEVVYDTSDAIQSFIHSSNGDKIYQGMNAMGTTLTCMINYQGTLLDNNDERYDTDFDYYWFRLSGNGTETYTLWLDDNGELQMANMEDNENVTLRPTSRVLPIKADHVDTINTFQCVVVDKAAQAAQAARAALLADSPTEEDLMLAAILNEQLGIDESDEVALRNTANEINAYNNSTE